MVAFFKAELICRLDAERANAARLRLTKTSFVDVPTDSHAQTAKTDQGPVSCLKTPHASLHGPSDATPNPAYQTSSVAGTHDSTHGIVEDVLWPHMSRLQPPDDAFDLIGSFDAGWLPSNSDQSQPQTLHRGSASQPGCSKSGSGTAVPRQLRSWVPGLRGQTGLGRVLTLGLLSVIDWGVDSLTALRVRVSG